MSPTIGDPLNSRQSHRIVGAALTIVWMAFCQALIPFPGTPAHQLAAEIASLRSAKVTVSMAPVPEYQFIEASARTPISAPVATPAPPKTPAPPAPPPPPVQPASGGLACGGDLPPCHVMQNESGGDPRIWNGGCYAPVGWSAPRSPCGGSTASGKWQIIRGTWGGHGGFLNAADAPVSLQDDKARILWASWHGHWGQP